MTTEEREIFRVILANQSVMLHALSIICDSQAVKAYLAADELRNMSKYAEEARKAIA